MKKLFTIVAALLTSFSLMAEEPNISFEIPASGAANEDYFKTWEAESSQVVISGTMSLSSNDSHQNISISSNAGNLTSNYLSVKVASAETIDSVAFLAGGSGNSKNVNAPVIGWAESYEVGQDAANALTYIQFTSAASGGGKIANAAWYVADFSASDIKEIRIYKKLSKNQVSINGEAQTSDLGSGETIRIWGMKIWLKSGKTIVSTVESLSEVKVNGVAVEAQQLAFLLNHQTLALTDEYVEAPEVAFTKHTVITYDDESTKTKDEDITVTASEVNGAWEAKATINEIEYTITAVKPASYTVSYYDGENLLGTEVVKAGEEATKYADYETKQLAEFVGWYTDAELTEDATDWTITADMSFYGEWEKAYATSLNIEQLVLDNGTKYNIKDELVSMGYGYDNIDALDSLNDDPSKTNRNYPFLGLKIKKTAGYIAFNLEQGHSVKVRFGNIGKAFTIKVNGVENEAATTALANTSVESANVFEYEATEADALIQIFGCQENKTLVIKQIMIDEDIEAIELPEPEATAIDNTNAEVTAVKAVRNGQLFIEKNGVLYNAQGAVVE